MLLQWQHILIQKRHALSWQRGGLQLMDIWMNAMGETTLKQGSEETHVSSGPARIQCYPVSLELSLLPSPWSVGATLYPANLSKRERISCRVCASNSSRSILMRLS